MLITFLGTGTSQGVPLINCDCPVCTSQDPRNKRLRSSVSVQTQNTTLLIDTTPDLRQQLLRYPISRLTAVLYTHAHADHIYGLDELRRFNYLQNERIPVYADQVTLKRLLLVFDYAFGNGKLNPGIPNLSAHSILNPFSINELPIIPIELLHGKLPMLGFRIGDFAYCTDVSQIPRDSYKKLKNLRLLVLDALRERTHPSHFSLSEAIEEAKKIAAEKTYFVHMSHNIDHEEHEKSLPSNINFAYDGLEIKLA
jgi:phosphoribosyl 1,2-cyclic phosphate phosphodiesterase